MRYKLFDIQSNKMFLEKKIQEYEKKLNELKGGNKKYSESKNKIQKANSSQKALLEKSLNE